MNKNCYHLQMTLILRIESPKNITKKTLELINEFCKVAGQKINTWKFVTLLYTKNKLSEREIKEITLCIIASKRIKYLGINLFQEVKDLYSENSKILMKETEGDMNKLKNIP